MVTWAAYRRVATSRTRAKFSTHQRTAGGSQESWTQPPRSLSPSVFMRASDAAYSRNGRTVATTRSMNATSVRTSPGMNTLAAWLRVCSGNR